MNQATISTFRSLLRNQDDSALNAMLTAGEVRFRELDLLVEALVDEIARRERMRTAN